GCAPSILLDELDERAERRLRVHEGDRGAAATGPGRIVDHLIATLLDVLQRLRARGDAVADVVDALTLAVEELRDGRVVAYRHEELDVRVGHPQQGLFDAVALDALAVLDVDAVRRAVVLHRGLEVVDGDGDVVDLGEHRSSWRSLRSTSSVAGGRLTVARTGAGTIRNSAVVPEAAMPGSVIVSTARTPIGKLQGSLA